MNSAPSFFRRLLTRSVILWTSACVLFSLVYVWWSYSLTAPNLILSSWPPYWQFQTWMWATFFNDRPLLSYWYLGIVAGWWLSYFGLIWQVAQLRLPWPTKKAATGLGLGLVLLAAPLLFANNALSYDVFNYIFNAKMVLVFHADPHQKVALDFAYDDWTRFMHNTHTTAPYGYGWTALSLLPFVAGAGKFLPTWVLFRMFSFLSWVALIAVSWWAVATDKTKARLWWWLALVANPLLLIEIITNSHNDLWMMVPALLSLAIVAKGKRSLGWLGLSLLLLGLSISTKLATVVLLPVWLLVLLKPQSWWALPAVGLMFAPLLTGRSQQFHPWYWSWVLVWLPLLFTQLKSRWAGMVGSFILIMSVTSSLRYLPYLWHGEYSELVLRQQKLITWSAVPIWLVVLGATLLLAKARSK